MRMSGRSFGEHLNMRVDASTYSEMRIKVRALAAILSTIGGSGRAASQFGRTAAEGYMHE